MWRYSNARIDGLSPITVTLARAPARASAQAREIDRIERRPPSARSFSSAPPVAATAATSDRPATSANAPADRSAINPTASPGPLHVINNPLSAGPTRPAAPKAQPLTTFAAVSSSGVATTAGRMAAWAGRVRVMPSAVSGARAKTMPADAPAQIAVANAAMVIACAA